MKLSKIKNSSYTQEYRVFDDVDHTNFYGFIYLKSRASKLWTARHFDSDTEIAGFKTRADAANAIIKLGGMPPL